MIFIGFLWFSPENRLVGNFHYHIRNQRVEIRKYLKFHNLKHFMKILILYISFLIIFLQLKKCLSSVFNALDNISD